MKETFFSALDVVQTLSAILVFLIGIGILVVIVMYIVDVNQTEHAIRRNFPVIGRFRYLFESLGEYFRQYFFAQDREEMPFNRHNRRVRLNARPPPGRHAGIRQLPVPGARNRRCTDIREDYRYLRAPALCNRLAVQCISDELRRNLETRGAGVVEGLKNGRQLDEYRRRRIVPVSPRGWRGYRIPDRHC
jgi:hypothetical protein